MNRTLIFAALQAAALTGSPRLFADELKQESRPSKDTNSANEQGDEEMGHGGQFSLRAALVAGYRVVFRYDKSHYCVDPSKDEGDPQQLCGFGAPLGIDLALAFAPLDVVEPYLWIRLGLAAEDPTDTEALKALGAGLRLYSRSDASLKIFIEPAVAFELEGSQDSPEYRTNTPSYNTDFIFHVAAGPQYDITPNVGLYLGAGLTAGIVRAIHTNMEVQFGLQGRI